MSCAGNSLTYNTKDLAEKSYDLLYKEQRSVTGKPGQHCQCPFGLSYLQRRHGSTVNLGR